MRMQPKILAAIAIIILSMPLCAQAPADHSLEQAQAVLAAMSGSADVEVNVTVYFEYLADSSGYDYGANYFLSSTVNETVCVFPSAGNQENVYGNVTAGPVRLRPNESHFSIGSFISRDRSKPWSVRVTATWRRC